MRTWVRTIHVDLFLLPRENSRQLGFGYRVENKFIHQKKGLRCNVRIHFSLKQLRRDAEKLVCRLKEQTPFHDRAERFGG